MTDDLLELESGMEHQVEDLAEQLRSVHEAVARIEGAGLTRRALVILIKDLDDRLGIRDIERVLNAMGKLDEYLTPEE